MKFVVTKADLMKKLTLAMGNVSTKNTVPAIEGVLIETINDGRVQITTYDMQKGLRARITPVEVEREGRYIINAQRLYQTVRVLPDDDITIDISENLGCTISCGRSVFSMSATRGADYPNMPDLVTERGFTVGADNLRRMISKVTHSIAISDNRPMLCGAYFTVNEGGFEVVSCDSFRLSRCSLKCDISTLSTEGVNNYSFIIPGTSLGEMMKILGDGEDEIIKVYLSRKHVIINKGDLTFFSRLIDSEYLDYKKIIPTANNIVVKVDRERLLSGLERANIIAEEKIQGAGRSYVKLKIEDHYLFLTSNSANGAVNDEMDCEHEGGDIDIAFNCRYLIDAIKVAEGEQVLIRLKSYDSAVTIEPVEESEDFSYFYMVLPRRTNEQR